MFSLPPPPPACVGNAPDSANAYSDGSAACPRTPHFCLMTAGVWHPARLPEHSALAPLEQHFAEVNWCDGGLELAASLTGWGASSTRAEILGLILAALAPFPVTVGCDSAAALATRARLASLLPARGAGSVPSGRSMSPRVAQHRPRDISACPARQPENPGMDRRVRACARPATLTSPACESSGRDRGI